MVILAIIAILLFFILRHLTKIEADRRRAEEEERHRRKEEKERLEELGRDLMERHFPEDEDWVHFGYMAYGDGGSIDDIAWESSYWIRRLNGTWQWRLRYKNQGFFGTEVIVENGEVVASVCGREREELELALDWSPIPAGLAHQIETPIPTGSPSRIGIPKSRPP